VGTDGIGIGKKKQQLYASTCACLFFLVCESERDENRAIKENKEIQSNVEAKHMQILGSVKTTNEAKILLF